MSDILTFGKYKGQNLEQVWRIDPDYLYWLMEEEIERDGIDWADKAGDVVIAHQNDEDDEDEICSICRQTSCEGPQAHAVRGRRQ